MLTRRIDAALCALADCRARVPDLRDLFAPGSAERAALDEVLTAIGRTYDALSVPRSPREF
jgi:hypothetical protein